MLHGRADELATLTALVDAARAGQGKAIAVLGEAGIGKTSLVEALASYAHGFQVLMSRGVESESDFAFGGLHQLLQPALPLIHRLPPRQASALLTAFGLEGGDASERLLVSVGVLSLVAELAEERPVLCLVDDAHWLDRASATALAFVARRLQAERVALVLVIREGERTFEYTAVNELRLGALDTVTSRAVLQDRYPHVLDAVADRLIDDAGGNPLALLETASSLTDAELDGSSPLPDELPAKGRLTDGFVARVRKLSEPAQTFLLILAVDDIGALANVLDAAGRLGVPASVLDEVETSRVIHAEAGSAHFRHPLIRSGVLHSSLGKNRRAAHTALAATYRALGDIERAAWHLAASTAGADERVAAALQEAAAFARSRGGFEAASSALEHSAALTPVAAHRARRLAAAAEDAWTAGQIERARALLDSSRTLAPEVSDRPHSLRLRAWIELTEGSVSAARAILWDGSRHAFADNPELSMEMAAAAAETAWVQSDTNALLDMARWASSIELTDSSSDEYHRRLLSGLTRHASGDVDGATGALRAAIYLAEQRDDTDTLNSAGHVAFYIGDDSAALRINSKVAGKSRVVGAIGRLLFALERQARAEILAGRWALAEATLQEASSLARSTRLRGFESVTSAWQAHMAALRGTDDFEMLVARAQASRSTGSLGILDLLLDGILSWARGLREASLGRPVSSLQWLARIEHPAIRTMAAFDQIEMAVASQSRREVAHAIEWAEALAADNGLGWAASAAAFGRAMSSDAPADTQLRSAIDKTSPSERPFDLARIQLALGAHLRRNRQRVEARRHLEVALAAFETLGAVPWSRRAGHELRASGQTARARDPSTVLDLTPQELQVARFVAEGLTNREVAARLFLSPRTVDYHLRKVFVKLGISSRSRLGQFLPD